MSCYCTANNLRFFIRSLVQIDAPVSARATPARRFNSAPIRHFRVLALRTPSPLSIKEYSTDSSKSNAFSYYDSNSRQRKESLALDLEDDGSTTGNAEDAFVEFSTGAIEELAAQSRLDSMTEEHTPVQSISNILSDGRTVAESKQQSHFSTGTKTVERIALKRHSSFPRLPRISRDVFEDPAATSADGYVAEEWVPQRRENWQLEKDARRKKYPMGWNPQKRLSPDAITGIRALNAQMPEKYHTRALAESFEVSPEAISRILRSKWTPSAEEETDRQRRWFKRGESIWGRYAELGVKPPKRWRELGIGKKGKPDLKKSTPKPALVTLPRREGGLYKVEKESDPGSIEDRIL